VAANPLAISAGSLGTDDAIIAVTGKTDIPYVSNAGYTAQPLPAECRRRGTRRLHRMRTRRTDSRLSDGIYLTVRPP